MAVKGSQMSAQATKVEEAINAAKKVIRGNVSVEIEGVEQAVLRAALSTHHLGVSSSSLAHSYDIRVRVEFRWVFQQNRPTGEVRERLL